jgi:cold shock CspA family protein
MRTEQLNFQWKVTGFTITDVKDIFVHFTGLELNHLTKVIKYLEEEGRKGKVAAQGSGYRRLIYIIFDYLNGENVSIFFRTF